MNWNLYQKAMLITLYCAVAVAVSAASRHRRSFQDQEGSGSGEGSGFMYPSSGFMYPSSGDGSGSGYDDHTHDPTSRDTCIQSDSTFSDPVSLDDAVEETRCRLLCLQKVLENETRDAEEFLKTNGPYTTLSTKDLHSDCQIYQMVHQCSVGCQMASNIWDNCPMYCFDSCIVGSVLPDSTCPSNCSKVHCNAGCALYQQLENIESEGPTPFLPPSADFTVKLYSSPYLHSNNVFQLSVNAGSTESLSSDNLTAFVVKVYTEEVNSHYFLVNLDDPLEIHKSLSCKNVSFSLLPVNEFGVASEYLANTTFVADGFEMWPSLPDHPDPQYMTLVITDDPRPGYWGHARINITWSRPNRAEYLSYFNLSIQPLNDTNYCSQPMKIPKIFEYYFVWESVMPSTGPIDDCVYNITVHSNPRTATYPGTPEPLSIHVRTVSNSVPSGYIAPVQVSCYFQENGGDFSYFSPEIEWSLPSNPLLLQGIQGFHLNLSVLTKDGRWIVLQNQTLDYVFHNVIRRQNTSFNDSYFQFLQELTILYRPGSHQYLETAYMCTLSLTDPPPIKDITVNQAFIDQEPGNFHLDISWNNPEYDSGTIQYYNIYVGREQLYNKTIPDEAKSIVLKVESRTSLQKIISSTSLPSNELLYIQIQPKSSIGLNGPWSDPYIFDPVIRIDVVCKKVYIPSKTATHQVFRYMAGWNVSQVNVKNLQFFNVLYILQIDNKTEQKVVRYEKSQTYFEQHFMSNIVDIRNTYDREIKVEPIFDNTQPGAQPKWITTSQGCMLDGEPIPPDAVNFSSMELEYMTINSNGVMNISFIWADPEVTNSGIKEYWIYIGAEILNGTDTPNNWILFVKRVLNARLNKITSVREKLEAIYGRNSSSEWNMYIQVMSINNIGKSANWSTAYKLSVQAVELMDITTSSTVTTTNRSDAPKPSSKGSQSNNNFQNLLPVMSAIIPIIFVLTLAIIVVLLLMAAAYCHRRSIAGVKDKEKSVYSDHHPMSVEYMWEKYPSDIEKIIHVGEGSFGEVHSGMLHQVLDLGGKKYEEDTVHVFVATLKVPSTDEQRYKFVNLLEKYKMLSNLEHPFLLAFQGCVTESQPFCLLTEYAENGDLLTFLQKHRRRMISTGASTFSAKVPAYLLGQHPSTDVILPVDLMNYSRQIASAMDCLAGMNMTHGDIACRNIYVDQNFCLKLADFGIVSNSPRDTIYVGGVPIRWASPELLVNHTYSMASDVWAFGVTVWEIITLGGFPYSNISSEDLPRAVTNGVRLPKPSNCLPKLFSLLEDCWKVDPRKRPTFERLHEFFLNQISGDNVSSLMTLNVSFKTGPPSHPQLNIHLLQSDSDTSFTLTESGKKSPTSSTDSAITEASDLMAGAAEKKTKKTDAAHKGFTNPTFRRSSSKAINLDQPRIQISMTTPSILDSTQPIDPAMPDTGGTAATEV